MDQEQLKAAVAPCGLNCEKCFAHVGGEIRRLSLQLREKLGNFEPYAQRYRIMLKEPVFEKYPGFKEMLDYFASENCRGCRNEQCKLFAECGIRPCHQEKQVDYCHQCGEFPCGNTNFDERLYKVWVIINQRIQKMGLERFYEGDKPRPRYP